MNENQTQSVLDKFDKLADSGRSPEMAFSVILEAYGNEDTKNACSTVKQAIENALEKLHSENRTIETNPVLRLRKNIQRLNKNIGVCSILINGVELTKEEILSAKVKLPSCFNTQETFTATASRKNKTTGMILEVRY